MDIYDGIYDDQWHYRLYLWSRRAWLRLLHREPVFEREQRYSMGGVNLCPYWRTLFLYLPLVVLAHGAVAGALGYVLFWMPRKIVPHVSLGFSWAGLLAALLRTGEILIIGALAIAVIVSVVWLVRRIPRKPRQGPGIFAVMGAYLAAAHDALCPHIPIKHRES